MSGDEIVEYVNELKQEARSITEEVAYLCVQLKGAVTWTEAWCMNNDQRKIFADILQNNK